MAKCLHYIYDAIGHVGSQMAGSKQRAVYLWACRYRSGNTAGLVAYDAANDRLPIDWEPESDDAWKVRDDALIYARHGK